MRVEPAVPSAALAAIRDALAPARATPVDAPILQPLNLLLDLAGEAMRARLFVVQAEGGAETCLRPDFTVAVARQHLEGGAASGRYIYEGPAFRSAPKGERAEEFLQLGVELFAPAGGSTVEADAEVAGLAWRAAAAGGREDLTLWLGDVGLFSAFIASLGLPEALAARLTRVAGRPRLLAAELARAGHEPAARGGGELAALLADLPQARAAALLEEVWALAGVEPVGGRGPGEVAARLVRRAAEAEAPALTETQAAAIHAYMAISAAPAEGLDAVRRLAGAGEALSAALADWDARLATLADIPAARMRFAPALGHAFDYYDGLTFEVLSDVLGPDRPVASGGRYDGLLARLGGPAQARAVGCVVRPWRAFAGGEA
ncbi:ATP phosphoribosyltransferase regulatory subunit [Phenylobacterium sp.]|uniref:ATP phosphoribosyltransferase regulatory subunit n=1 Tax=Phenylobacterium sp. TaxID=1871053 RepID=UPI0011F855A1|nr:ATP phosphoribosyltransferase regulatory subunit [Phenylobacterium sp.]THD60439.1 MAG: ATP phosphoribosyltransferase regulatory subunit [Phenylobacterium sp.]